MPLHFIHVAAGFIFGVLVVVGIVIYALLKGRWPWQKPK
jgi:hypothetical protein